MFDKEDGYLGFTFAGHHSSEFGLLVVSDGSRYHQNLFSDFSDTITQVPGMNGGYYFGTQIGMKNFDIQCAFDNMNSHMMRKIEQWLYPNKTGWLIFDETSYKKYYVKISQNIQFNFIPFDEHKNKKNLHFQRDIFKGEITIPFFSFYEYGIGNEDYDLPSFTTGDIIKQQAIDSGLLPREYNNKKWLFTTNNNTTTEIPSTVVDNISVSSGFAIYNAGNGIADADFYFTVDSNQISKNSPLIIFNYDDGNDYILEDPTNIIKQQTNNSISFPCEYKIEILGTKKEVWVTCTSESTQSSKINIGGCYNQYYPKVYHKKPSDIMMINQPKSPNTFESASTEKSWSGEPIFYSYSWNNNNDYRSSDWKEGMDQSAFEEFQDEWSDYTIVTEKGVYSINNVINPATIFFSVPDKESLTTDALVFLIYPDKFSSNKVLRDFSVQFKNTYI